MKNLLFTIALLSLCLSVFAAKQPNVVIFLSDDQGWGDLSVSGNTNLSTPNIDSLARDGAKFESFYVCAVCSPTRAEFLTGRYHPRGGVYSTSAGGERLDLDETTVADLFKAAGYRTAAYGKWHNGMQYPYHPNGRGFDEYYGFCSGHWGHYFDPMLEHNGNIVKGKGFCIDDFTNHGIDFIEQSGDKPFFCYFAYNTPHAPMQVPDEYWDRFKDKDLKMHNREPQKESNNHLRCALAMCENIDWNVGRVLKKLDELKLADNTIVLYFSDNGPNGWRWNGDMRGKKGWVDEGGVRSPLMMRWPGTIKPGIEIKHISSATDLLPSLTELCGVPQKVKKPLDGISFVPLLQNPEANFTDRLIINNWKKKISVRSQRFRLDKNNR
ncbi:MAG: arylsulfatase, partial [Kiritimatiellae bacterium]|nr:arylsulfatase [Kiritimatiellia bacterium]